MDSVFETVEITPEEKAEKHRIEEREHEIQRIIKRSELSLDEVYALWNGYNEGTRLGDIEIYRNFIKQLLKVIHSIEREIDPCDCRFNPNEMMLVAFALGYGAGEKKHNIEIISLLKELRRIEDEAH